MKKSILYLALMLAPIVNAQKTTDYTLGQAVNVGCSSGVADLGKKITVERTDVSAKFSLINMACSKSYDGSLKVDFGAGATGYFDGKQKKGIVIDGQVISLFNNEGGKYQVVVAGHEDKKQAKTLTSEAQQTKYQTILDGFDALLVSAKKEAELAKLAANTLPIPKGDFSDKYGIGGLYYFSEPALISSNNTEIDGKNVQAVLLQMDEADNNLLKAHYAEGKYDKFFLDGIRMLNAFKAGSLTSILMHKGDNMNSIKFFDDSSIERLEEGMYIINYRGWYRSSGSCTNIVWTEQKKQEIANGANKYILLGKDKKRIEELMNNPAEIERLASMTTTAGCKLQDALEAAAKPMPAASAMNTGQLKTDATVVTKAFAVGRWSQEVLYSYIMGKEWFIIKTPVTGVITGRVISAIAIMKDDSGQCKWEEISIRQDYNGSTYGKSYFGGESTVIIPVDCATAMKYK